MPWREKLIIALDVSEPDYALELVDKFGEQIEIYKVGLELFTSAGPKIVQGIHKRKKKVFLDLKLHDIPNTAAKAAVAAARLGVYMFNVHASGGLDMMKMCKDAVVELCLKENLQKPRILGVTVLTSMSQDVLKAELGIQHSLNTHVRHLSALALKAGLDGVVASGHEVSKIKNHCGKGFIIVTPGIRPSWHPPDDQHRTMTPKQALREGADYIVMGRAIINSDNPLKTLELISLEMLTV